MREDPTLAWSARTRDRSGRSDELYLARLEIHVRIRVIFSNDRFFFFFFKSLNKNEDEIPLR